MARKYVYENEETEKESSGVSKKVAFLLVGGGIGAALALLFAPKSGRELRGDIADVSRKGLDKSRETANQLRDNSGVYYEQIKGQAGNAYNRATEAATAAANKLRNRSTQNDGESSSPPSVQTERLIANEQPEINSEADAARNSIG